jgi:two-component system, NarL family, sensor histidine kinase DevS
MRGPASRPTLTHSLDNAAVEERIRAIVEAGIAITAELSLDAVLEKIASTAAALTEARYAALGVLDEPKTGLERFITVGIDGETRTAIGPEPHGRGILGVLIREARPLRLRDLTKDRRSVGFPAHHPPMHSFLGVPILLRGVAYGNLYLTEKRGGADFTQDDEELVTMLAAQAAVAIENARLYEAATRWLRQLESLNEIGNALVGEFELGRQLTLVVQRLRGLVDARIVFIALPAGPDRLHIAAYDGIEDESLLETAFWRSRSKAGRVLDRRRGERVDDLAADPEVDLDVTAQFDVQTGLYIPLVTRNRAIGVLVAHDKRGPDIRFSDDDRRLAEAFAARAAVAVDLSERVARDAMRRVMSAQELERRRLARELHDETGQALTSILLGLKAAEDAGDREAMQQALASLRELVVGTLQSVRRLAVELRPRALDDFGLVPALERLTEMVAEQSGIVVTFAHDLAPDRLPGEVETTLYRIVQESLTNVVKHAGATRVAVELSQREGLVTIRIADDGRGFEPGGDGADDGIGLVGMRERMRLIDGRLRVDAHPESGTTIVAEVPV